MLSVPGREILKHIDRLEVKFCGELMPWRASAGQHGHVEGAGCRACLVEFVGL